MEKTVRGLFVFAFFCLCLNGLSPAQAYEHEGTGISFPENLAGLEKGKVTDFEKKYPGLGVGVGYNGPGITVTIYVFTMGIKTIPDGPDSPAVRKYFRKAVGEILDAGKAGYYLNIRKISEERVAWGESSTAKGALHASFCYDQKGRDRLSHLYLSGFRNHFIKVRFTYDKEVRSNAEKVRKDLTAEFEGILRDRAGTTHR